MLKLQNVSKYYKSNDIVAMGLRKVSLEFKLGEFIGITGESGSGKSTLLNVISGLDTYEDGELYINGEETSHFTLEDWEHYRRQYIGFVFQNYNLVDSYTVLENVLIALTIQGYDKSRRKARALELIERVGLASHINHKASKLSGGQKQRVVMARALAKDCPIIVADEPTGNLDTGTSKQIIDLLKEISKDKLVIVVTHNFDEIKEHATRKIRLFDGEVAEDKQIKSYSEVTTKEYQTNYNLSLFELTKFSFRNLIRTPRRSIFTFIVALFIMLVFTFSFGSFSKNTEGGGNIYGNNVFENVSDRRLIVTKYDATPFDTVELTELNSINRVNYLLKHDVIMDKNIYSYDDQRNRVYSVYNLMNPADMLNKSDLVSGRLPTSKYEVVVEDIGDYAIGDSIQVGFDEVIWGLESSEIPPTAERFSIVGITKQIVVNDYRTRFYFHQSFLNAEETIREAYLGRRYENQYFNFEIEVTPKDDSEPVTIQLYDMNFLIDDSLESNQVLVGYQQLDQLSQMMYKLPYEENEDFYLDLNIDLTVTTSFYDNTHAVEIIGEYTQDESSEYFGNVIAMNQTTFESFVDLRPYQITLLVDDAYDGELIIDEVKDEGYNVIYPANILNQFSEISQLISTIFFGFLMVILLIIIYFISYVILKNIQRSKRKDFIIFRSIGASKKDLNKVTILELILLFTFSYIVIMALLLFNESLAKTSVPQYLKYYQFSTYFVVYSILLIISLLLGYRFNKKVFSDSVITSLTKE
ncbi:MAG: ABC transporter ATP-binding protein [Candidatus Izimaplasma sp.]|nr:ABC transporter ATP-binding protein [Candidatus Izimaplasma bacterium]